MYGAPENVLKLIVFDLAGRNGPSASAFAGLNQKEFIFRKGALPENKFLALSYNKFTLEKYQMIIFFEKFLRSL